MHSEKDGQEREQKSMDISGVDPVIELDDGKILTGLSPINLMVNSPWVSGVDFPLNQSNDPGIQLLQSVVIPTCC